CMRETLRLALKELEGALTPETRPNFWLGLWERYVESQTDYRAGSETLARKLAETGTDAWQLLEWLRQPERCALAAGEQAQLLARVFAEQFEFRAGQAVAAPKETLPLAANRTPAVSEGLEAGAPPGVEAPPQQTPTKPPPIKPKPNPRRATPRQRPRCKPPPWRRRPRLRRWRPKGRPRRAWVAH